MTARRPQEAEVLGKDGAGLDGEEVSSSLMVVLPASVDTDRVACPLSFSTLLKISNKLASSSPIFSSSQNLKKKKKGAERVPLSCWLASDQKNQGHLDDHG